MQNVFDVDTSTQLTNINKHKIKQLTHYLTLLGIGLPGKIKAKVLSMKHCLVNIYETRTVKVASTKG